MRYRYYSIYDIYSVGKTSSIFDNWVSRGLILHLQQRPRVFWEVSSALPVE